MKRNIFLSISLLAFSFAMAQAPIKLTGVKKKQDTQVSVTNYQVSQTNQKTMVTMDFVLDSLKVKSARYRAFTPILRSRSRRRPQGQGKEDRVRGSRRRRGEQYRQTRSVNRFGDLGLQQKRRRQGPQQTFETKPRGFRGTLDPRST